MPCTRGQGGMGPGLAPAAAAEVTVRRGQEVRQRQLNTITVIRQILATRRMCFRGTLCAQRCDAAPCRWWRRRAGLEGPWNRLHELWCTPVNSTRADACGPAEGATPWQRALLGGGGGIRLFLPLHCMCRRTPRAPAPSASAVLCLRPLVQASRARMAPQGVCNER